MVWRTGFRVQIFPPFCTRALHHIVCMLWGLGFAPAPCPAGACPPLPAPGAGPACASAAPIILPLCPGEGVRDTAVGKDAVFAVTSGGRVLAWGCSTHGRLGAETDTHDAVAAVEVAGLGRAVAVVSSCEHALAVNANGEVFSWGSSLAGRLGIGARAAVLPCRAGHLPYTRVPERVHFPANKRIVGLVSNACARISCEA